MRGGRDSIFVLVHFLLSPLAHWLADVVENRPGDSLRGELLVEPLEAHSCSVGDEDGIVKEEDSVGHHSGVRKCRRDEQGGTVMNTSA